MKPFTTLACVVLGLIALAQLARALFGWDIVINGVPIPAWPSFVAAAVAGTLAVMTWREAR